MKKIGVIGASGFVGHSLLNHIKTDHAVIAFSRDKTKKTSNEIEWRHLDLFSAQSSLEALKGVDTAVYLVHSMMPSSVLFQGNFHDTDLLLADNFARACKANDVKHIIYLGGIMPDGYVSPHLQSRREVEGVLASTGIPFTALRAGMIVGPGGSSFEILRTLVLRLPFMILPEWTQRSTQAIFLDDVIRVIAAAIDRPEFKDQTCDVVNGEFLTYEALLRRMAQLLNRKRWMIAVPIRTTEFSKLWVQIFGGATRELVSPLIDSLLCDLPRTEPNALVAPYIRFKKFEEMVAETLSRSRQVSTQRRSRRTLRDHTVRSIQRLPSIPSHDSRWIAEEYMKWLPKFLPLLIRVKTSDDQKFIRFFLGCFSRPLLVLEYIHGSFDEDRQKFHIVGGILTKTTETGWLEFRQVQNKKYTLSAIHEFVPSLPWPIYVISQAPLHKFVMNSFGKYIERIRLRKAA